jgi:hypothetical protein
MFHQRRDVAGFSKTPLTRRARHCACFSALESATGPLHVTYSPPWSELHNQVKRLNADPGAFNLARDEGRRLSGAGVVFIGGAMA